MDVFAKVMLDFHDHYADKLESLLTYLNREGDTKVAQAVDAEWKRRILKAHKRYKRDVPLAEDGVISKEDIYKLYGTTLVGMMITPSFLFAFQLGDGDIVYVNGDGVSHVLQSDKILGTETRSLCTQDSWKRSVSLVRHIESDENLPFAFMLATDGLSNSHVNEQEFQKTCADYFATIRTHGVWTVRKNLKQWLAEISEMGCGDDTTLLIAYFDEKVEEVLPPTKRSSTADDNPTKTDAEDTAPVARNEVVQDE